MKNKYRIILISNPANSIFISSYLNKNMNKHEVKNFIIKHKIHSDLTNHKSIIRKEDRLSFSNKYNIYLSDELLTLNYNVEYLIDLFKVKLIISSFSQGQINVKKFFSEVETYMVDRWYIDFWKKVGREKLLHNDYNWLIDFYYKKYINIFKLILPKRIN